MEIKWKIITESPAYEISNIGTIRYKGTNREKGCSFDKDGYLVCSLSGKHFKVHRLVAKYFVDNDDIIHKNIVNHKDEDKTNNTVENLEWCSHTYNQHYGTKAERQAKSKGKPVICITTGEIYYCASEAMRETGIDKANIHKC